MIAEQVLEELRTAGVLVEARGEVLHIEAPQGVLSPDRIRSLRELKSELLRLISADGWPPESLDSERRFGSWHARLYPFVGETVSTPRGAGRLVQVFPERASVILPGEERIGVFLPGEVLPARRHRAQRDRPCALAGRRRVRVPCD